MYSLNYSSTLEVDDDNLFYILSAYELVNSENAHAAKTGLMDELRIREAEPGVIDREQARMDYTNNYRLLSLTWLAVASIWESIQSEHEMSARAVDIDQFWAMFYWSPILLVTIFFFVLALKFSWRESTAFIAVIVTVALLSSYYGEYYRFFQTGKGWLVGLESVSRFVISMSDHFNIFSYKPRGLFTLFLMVVFILRWRGQNVAAYLLLGSLIVVHQSNAALIFAMLIGIDIVIRVEIFADKRLLAIVMMTALFIALRESLWNAVGYQWLIVALVPALAMFVVIGYVVRKFGHVYLASKARAKAKLLSVLDDEVSVRIVLDLLIILTVWVLSFIAVFYMHKVGAIEQFSYRYFWGQLHTRWGAMILPSLMLGVFLLIICSFGRYALAALWAGVLVCVIIVATPYQEQADQAKIRESQKYEEGKQFLESSVEQARSWEASGQIDIDRRWEMVWYVALIMQTKGNYVIPRSSGQFEESY
jgi:hypothetical protein